MSRLLLAGAAVIVIATLAPVLPGSGLAASIRAYACQYPTDAVLAWAQDEGVHVDVRDCPPREEK